MAAAALRHAARRIGTQAADQRLSEALRGLDPEKRDAAMRLLKLDPKWRDAAMRLLHIQQRKEELYQLIDGWQSVYPSTGPLAVKNSRLLNQLSLQVTPRHGDPRWRSCRRWAIAGECFKYAGGYFIAKTAGEGLVDLYREVQQPSGK